MLEVLADAAPIARNLGSAARRPRARAPAALARLRGRGRRSHVPALHAPRAGRHREVTPRRRLPRTRRRLCGRAPRALPLVRRGNHVLAARRDARSARHRAARASSRRRRRRRGSRSEGCSRRARPSGRRSSSSTTCSGPSRCSSTSSSTSPTSRATRRSSCSASRAPSCSTTRPDWGGGKLNATSLLLEPLGDDECAELIDDLLGERRSTPALRERITAASAGNPLFVEEMLAMVREQRRTARSPCHRRSRRCSRRASTRWTARCGSCSSAAAVEGEVFHRGAVAELVPTTMRAATSTSTSRASSGRS